MKPMDDVKHLRASIRRYEQAYYNELRTLVERYPQLSGNFPVWLKGAKSIVATLCPNGILVTHWPSQQASFKFRQSPRPLEIVLEQTTSPFRVTFSRDNGPYQSTHPGLNYDLAQAEMLSNSDPSSIVWQSPWHRLEVVADLRLSYWNAAEARLKATNAVLQFVAAHLMNIPQPKPPVILNKLAAVIDEFKSLISSDPAEESVQRYLEENPILLSQTATTVTPKLKLGTEHITDFAVNLPDNKWILVEIEKPGHRLFVKSGDPASALTHAQRQVEDWRDWIAENISYARKSLPGIKEPECWVVIGRRSEMTEEQQQALARKNAEFVRIRIFTYDDLIDAATQHLQNLQRFAS